MASKELCMDLCQMSIALPAIPTAVEQSAAQELNVHIDKISGKALPVYREGQEIPKTPVVYIGATQFAANHQCIFPDNDFDEGWAIKAVNGNLVLCGGQTRGVLYAVYHLLEDVLGVRWWNLWEEYTPTADAVLVPMDYAETGVPDMQLRDAFMYLVKTDSLFCVRNRLNAFSAVNAPADYGGKEDFGLPAHVHTLYRYFPAYYADGVFSEPSCPYDADPAWRDMNNPTKENYLETHPEWFALTKRGKRVPNRFCLSDKGFRQTFKKKLLDSIAYCYEKAEKEGTLKPRFFDISLSDTTGECQCEACKASVRDRGLSGHLLRFVNEMAETVKPLYPDIRVETIVYSNYLEPPLDDTKPADNVVVTYANNDMDILHDLRHENNRQVLDYLLIWKNLCCEGNLYFWDYGVVYSQNGVFPNMYRYAENFRILKELGINGYSLEIEQCINTDFWDMKVWMAAKLAENPCLDFDKLLDDFIMGYYGKNAGPYIRQYLDFMHEKAEACKEGYRFASSISRGEWLSVTDIVTGDALFEAAFEAADGDAVLLRRLRAARSGIDRVIVDNFDKWKDLAEITNEPFSLVKSTVVNRLVETFTEQVALRGEWDPCGEPLLRTYKELLSAPTSAENESVDVSKMTRLAKANGFVPSTVGVTATIVPETELQALSGEKQYVFTAQSDFNTVFGGNTQKDVDSVIGKAAIFDMQSSKNAGTLSYEFIKQYWSVTDDDDCKTIPIGICLGKKNSDGFVLSTHIGSLKAGDLIVDGKYHWYKFSDLVAIENENENSFHMFRDWSFQIYTLAFELKELKGKKVDFYLSMKVSGDISCDNPDNLPSYSVDQIIIAER